VERLKTLASGGKIILHPIPYALFISYTLHGEALFDVGGASPGPYGHLQRFSFFYKYFIYVKFESNLT
jgi:hypothetical protein